MEMIPVAIKMEFSKNLETPGMMEEESMMSADSFASSTMHTMVLAMQVFILYLHFSILFSGVFSWRACYCAPSEPINNSKEGLSLLLTIIDLILSAVL